MMHLKEGDKAPAFTAIDQDGKKMSLADFKGKKIVLYFYPEDDTPTCTVQACNLRDNYSFLKKQGFEILGISPDEAAKHKKFETKYSLPFTLLADPSHAIIDKYGVWGMKNYMAGSIWGYTVPLFWLMRKGLLKKYFYGPKTNNMHRKSLRHGRKCLMSDV